MACRGVVLFEDEASFWLDGTLHQTWARIGQQPRVDTYGERKTAHIYGTVSLDKAQFTFQFAKVFNGKTFFCFLKKLVTKYVPRKVFIIIDNGPHHNLDNEGKQWLKQNRDKIRLFRLPPYSPELNPIEAVWKTTRKLTTHNRFYKSIDERNEALRNTFYLFRRKPGLISAHVARYR